ncbi:MAG: DedA family protein [bacterium]
MGIGDILSGLTSFAKETMQRMGPLGVFLLMAMESMVIPIPSEAVMPLAGVLAAQGSMSIWAALLAASLGSIAGSYLSYLLGAYGFAPVVERYGKYVLVQKHHLDSAHAWLERRGAWAIFVCRFIPGVRHVISIPAGSARMPLRPFLLATFVGATIWNVFLFWIGYKYGEAAADKVKPYLDVVGVGLLVLLVAYITFEVVRARRHRRDAAKEE